MPEVDPLQTLEQTAQAYFSSAPVVEHYRLSVSRIGLWKAEERVLTQMFAPTDRLLDVGTGTGRIALGLSALGYAHILGIDSSRPMVREARLLARVLERPVPFHVADACALPFEDGLYDGVIFGFNGWAQIPGRAARQQAARELTRVTRPGGRLMLTTPNREDPQYRAFWEAEAERWKDGPPDPALREFGDLVEETGHDPLYIHVPLLSDVRADLEAAGWTDIEAHPRAQLAREAEHVDHFAGRCVFWLATRG